MMEFAMRFRTSVRYVMRSSLFLISVAIFASFVMYSSDCGSLFLNICSFRRMIALMEGDIVAVNDVFSMLVPSDRWASSN